MSSLFLAGDDNKPKRDLTHRLPNVQSRGAATARVLIVEDDYLVALELEHHLREAGLAVVGTAATAEEALDIAAREKPEIAIMDIRLASARDGVDAATQLNATFGIRSIFATAHTDEAIRKRGQAADPLGWLQKPYPIERLIALINQAMSKLN